MLLPSIEQLIIDRKVGVLRVCGVMQLMIQGEPYSMVRESLACVTSLMTEGEAYAPGVAAVPSCSS